MPEVRSARTDLLRTLTVDSTAIIGLVLFLTLPLAIGVAKPDVASSALSHDVASAPELNLTVDPATYWMRAGASVTLRAVWTVGSPLCGASPLWYSWDVSSGSATGLLNETTGPTVTFGAESFTTGTATVVVRAEAILSCSANQSVLERSSSASLSVVVPLTVTGVALSSYLLSPGTSVTLSGEVSGGTPPYELDVVWGDGVVTNLSLPSPGNFSVAHVFPSGEFVPEVLGHDASGDPVNASVPEAVSVGTGFRVTVVPQRYVVELGTPVDFSGEVVDAPSGSVVLFDCSNAVLGPSNSSSSDPNVTSFSCTFDSAGTEEVLFGSYPSHPGGSSASTVLYETVVGPPRVLVTPALLVAEVGMPAPVEVNVSGGALPLRLAWNLTGNRSRGSEVADSNGPGVLTISADTPGSYSLGIRAVDALGTPGTNDTTLLDVSTSLHASADGARSFSPAGAVARVAGSVVAGCPPFSWWTVPAVAASNETAAEGSLDVVGGFVWNGTYLQEGTLSIVVVVADACGAFWQTNLTVPLLPELSSQVSIATGTASSNATVAVNVSVQGGWAPFCLWVNASDGESWNRTIPLDGATSWLFPASASGALVVRVALTDALGARSETSSSIYLPPVPSSSPPPPQPSSNGSSNVSTPIGGSADPSAGDVASLVLAFLVPIGTAVVAGVIWRRRARGRSQRASGNPGPDPESVLRHIIEPAEGAERFTVELLAEEAGVPLPVVRTTIDRLVAEGKVCSENGADGEEVLSWSNKEG